MHPALALSEILDVVFHHIGELDGVILAPHLGFPGSRVPYPPSFGKCKKTLARLARTCKTFNQVAIDQLWSDMDLWTIYMYLVPHLIVRQNASQSDLDPSKWRQTTYYNGDETIWIANIKCLSETDTKTILKYTPSIRTLHLPSTRASGTIPSPALRALALWFASVPNSFPRLETLYIDSPYFDTLQDYVPLAFHTKYIHLTYSYRGVGNPLLGFMDECASCEGPQFHSLHFNSTFSPSQKVSPTVIQAIARASHLRTLVCSGLNEHTLAHLSQLPFLEYLSVQFVDKLDAIPALSFPSLQTLVLQFSDYREVLLLLQKLARIPPSLRICPSRQPSLEHLESLFILLSQELNSQIQSLTQDSPRQTNEYEDSRMTVTLHTIRPLLVFSALRNFDWVFSGRIHFTDGDIEMMAQEWPLLEQLRITSTSDSFIPATTLNGLFSLARFCRHLERLALPVDVADLAEIRTGNPADGVSHWRLRLLHLRTSGVDASGQATLATIFAQVFPRLGAPGSVVVSVPRSQAKANSLGFRWDLTGSQFCMALRIVRQAKEEGRISSWTDEGMRKRLIQHFEST